MVIELEFLITCYIIRRVTNRKLSVSVCGWHIWSAFPAAGAQIGWGKCVWATQRGRQVTKKFSVGPFGRKMIRAHGATSFQIKIMRNSWSVDSWDATISAGCLRERPAVATNWKKLKELESPELQAENRTLKENCVRQGLDASVDLIADRWCTTGADWRRFIWSVLGEMQSSSLLFGFLC